MSELSYRAHMRCLYWALSLELCTSNFLHDTAKIWHHPVKVHPPALTNIAEWKHEDAVAVGIRVHSGDEDLWGRIGHRKTENDEGDGGKQSEAKRRRRLIR